MTSHAHDSLRSRDRGSILPLVLVIAIVLSLVVVALAKFITTDLRYATVASQRIERQSAATSAITYGVERIRLGQTLCASPASDFGPTTAGLLDRNNTTTTLTCQRLSGGASDVTGWAAVITGIGISSDLLEVQDAGTKVVDGQIFIDDAAAITFSGSPTLQHRGDLWYHRATCPGSAVSLPGAYTFFPGGVRGPLCTTATWDQVVTAPPVPDLAALPLNDGSVYSIDGACHVFAPGHYTGPPDTGPNAYFQSGDYYFDISGSGTWSISSTSIWFGNPGATTGSEEVANPACTAARDADPNDGGAGAVAYLGGKSSIYVANNGRIELFPKAVAERSLSLQALAAGSGYPASTETAASNDRILAIGAGNTRDLVVHGLVWAPAGWVHLDNSSNSSSKQLLGGVVVARLWFKASNLASGFEISPAMAPMQSQILLTATSTTTGGGASTKAQAVVEVRVDETDPDRRVAVNSLRVFAG